MVLLMAGTLALGATHPGAGAQAAAGAGSPQGAGPVLVIPVKGTIEPGLASFVERGLAEAARRGTPLVVLEIDTFGGRVDAATELRDVLLATPVRVVALVHDRAWSAGALIALAAPAVAVTPGASIGAAEPRPADAKTIAAVRAEFEATARARGRPADVAAAMVDARVVLPGLVAEGQILSLDGEAAVRWGVADWLVPDRDELLRTLGFLDPPVEVLAPTPAERVARFLTDPTVSALLMGLGLAGLVVELFTPGVGVPGAVGLGSLALFFGGRMVAGLAGWEAAALFLVGLVLLALELFVTPGFGVLGILGIVALLGGLVIAFPDPGQGATVLLLGLVVAGGLVALGWRRFRRTSAFSRLVLMTRQERAQGYVAPALGLEKLVGAQGVARTPLRPSGSVVIGGHPVDAVSQGAFIAAGRPVRVVAVDGLRVVVEEEHPAGS
ncbi:NfeD family protein [Limnochorda pilosa]|uniref:Uncharacterized protein n=1 Tax=Limnochorda pilosa TaxID=1555112 RepID=A0A0K2SMY8_LIMPI|nr:NfeD family protein [Limnochorda pilosa]BAS28481.1 hypothetical protein LIP_2651 [Limnochorda pilosa]